ncbi:MAG: CoA-binding protein [Acidobacteria bacterium]|nr:CoA-binding protein [Acidobacteriota bacterium]
MPADLDILKQSRVIAVVGLSSNRFRPSYEVAEYMQRAGYRIIPVNPNEAEVLGEKSYACLADIPEPVDCVNIFRHPNAVPAIVENAIAIGAKSIWMQQGIAHTEAAERARAAGLLVVESSCIMIDHRRLAAQLRG